MGSRWFSAAVVVFWLATMTWLVTTKILPPLRPGEPPSYQAIIEAKRQESLVAFEMTLNGESLGWATTSFKALPDGCTELRGRVHFDRLPVVELTPGWINKLIKLMDQSLAKMKMDARSTLRVDANGKLSRVHSTVRIDPLQEEITLDGRVDGSRLMLQARSKDFSYQTELSIPSGALVGDALAPQTQLPGLHAGQTWNVPTYSPLRPLNSPVELLRASVDGREQITWGGQEVECWRVTYRSESGFSEAGTAARGHLWVRDDGTVLVQDAVMFDSTLKFERLTPRRAVEILRHLWEHRDR